MPAIPAALDIPDRSVRQFEPAEEPAARYATLGLLIANGYQYMLSGKYWISFYPGIALLVTIVAINLVGDQLRDVLNPRLQR